MAEDMEMDRQLLAVYLLIIIMYAYINNFWKLMVN